MKPSIDMFDCTKCGTSFPRTKDFFYKLKSGKDGLGSWCKECQRKYYKEKRRNIPSEQKKLGFQSWVNKGNNKEIKAEKDRTYQRKHKKEAKERLKKWVDDNREKVYEYNRNRSRNKKHIISKAEWDKCKRFFNYRCAYCWINENVAKKEQGNMLHKEHFNHDGSNDITNCIPSCKVCNSSKGTLDPIDFFERAKINSEKIDLIFKWFSSIRSDCMSNRKLKLIDVTELDRATRKVALPEQNIDYNLLVGEYFTEYMPVEQGLRMIIFSDCVEGTLRTSNVSKVEETETHITVETRNTVYFFEIIEGDEV